MSRVLQFRTLARTFLLGLSVASVLGLASAPTAQAEPSTTRRYADVRNFLRELVAKHPQTTRGITIGVSDDGEPIEGVRIGGGPIHTLVVATHHGNEYGSAEIGLAFAQFMAEQPMQGYSVFVIPVLNIGGYDRRIRGEVAGGRRYDPNRDYPGPCGTEGPFKLRSTTALARFIDEANIVSSATLHTYFPAVLYPWGLSTRDTKTAYDDIYIALAKAGASFSGYQYGNSTELLYPADGTFEDYAFWRHGIWSMLYEMGPSHSPSIPQIQEMVRGNVPGIRRMLEMAPRERAPNHAFTGRCDTRLKSLDRHDE